jgi:uncharacterized protein YgiM (DUF1202 family)
MAGSSAVIKADALRLRGEPNLSSPVLAMVALESTSAATPGKAESWYDVLVRNQDSFAAAFPEFRDQEANPLLAYVNTGTSVLNIRSGPGTAFDILSKVSGGNVLTVLSGEAGWYEVIQGDARGYISGDHVLLMTQSEYEAFQETADYKGAEIARYAQNFLGARYVYGGNGPNAFDCSGFVNYIYKQFGYSLNRGASSQLENGYSVEKSELQAGDLVFFNAGGTSMPVSHVGLYVGEGTFIHASTQTKGVRLDNLDSGYYADVYVYARRIV